MLAGTYSDFDFLGRLVSTTTISTTGQVNITEFGCENFVGHVSIPNGNFNQIRFEYSSPNCGSATSAGVYDPGKDIFYTVGTTSDQAWGFFFESRRQ